MIESIESSMEQRLDWWSAAATAGGRRRGRQGGGGGVLAAFIVAGGRRAVGMGIQFVRRTSIREQLHIAVATSLVRAERTCAE
jgi:hypothetical protein